MTNDGDNLGIIELRVKLLILVIKNLDHIIETIRFGTCVKLAWWKQLAVQ
jgi:hypothetical protein